MMTKKHGLLFLFLLCASAFPALGQTSPQSGGPTMQQTVDFINQTIQQQGTTKNAFFQYFQGKVSVTGSCMLSVQQETVANDHENMTGGKYTIDLTKVNPQSISSVAPEEMFDPATGHAVRTGKLVSTNNVLVKTPFITSPLDAPLSGVMAYSTNTKEFQVAGVVTSIDKGSRFTLLPFSGKPPMVFKLTKNTAFHGTMQRLNLETGNGLTQPGDELQETSFKQGAYLNVSFDEKNVGKKEIEAFYISIERNAGDNEKPRDLTLFYGADIATAEHVTKAFIHAAALCYKAPAAPPPALF